MSLSIEDATRFAQVFKNLVNGVFVAVLDKRQAVRLALTTMFAEGHLSLEDTPGTGKAAPARTISAVIDGTHSCIQLTLDLLPSDITGVNVFNQKTGEWVFHAGPVFAEIVLADEINRVSPKTQSALLEVVKEAQVTVDGVRRPASQLFMVIVAQNPVKQAGTYPLSEVQLDRFLIKTPIGYPSCSAMINVSDGSASSDRSRNPQSMVSGQDIVAWSVLAADNHADRAVLDYVVALVEAMREGESSMLGASTRGAVGMIRYTRVWATVQGHNSVLSDDVKTLVVPLWAHRIVVDPDVAFFGATSEGVIQHAPTPVPVPAVGA